jgi:hypothetical protein
MDMTDKGDERRGVFVELITREQVENYLEELVEGVETARLLTTEPWAPAEKSRDNLMIRYGRALGALGTLMHCRRINSEDYSRWAARVHGALLPRVVQVIGS